MRSKNTMRNLSQAKANTQELQAVLNPPQIIAVDYGQAGELKLRVSGDGNRKAIQGRIKKATDGDFGPTITFRNSKAIVFKALTAGTTYVMQLCGIGGSTGTSDWSESVSKMAL